MDFRVLRKVLFCVGLILICGASAAGGVLFTVHQVRTGIVFTCGQRDPDVTIHNNSPFSGTWRWMGRDFIVEHHAIQTIDAQTPKVPRSADSKP